MGDPEVFTSNVGGIAGCAERKRRAKAGTRTRTTSRYVGEVQPPVAVACERVWQPELETGLDPVVMEVTHTVECWMSRGTRRREVYFEFLGHSCASRDLKLLVDTTDRRACGGRRRRWREEDGRALDMTFTDG